MVKARAQITVDPNVWRRFKREVENASHALESYMRRYVGDEDETYEEVEENIESIKEEMESLEAELHFFEERREELENRVERWVCLDCGHTEPGTPDDVERCPDCRGDRIGEYEEEE